MIEALPRHDANDQERCKHGGTIKALIVMFAGIYSRNGMRTCYPAACYPAC